MDCGGGDAAFRRVRQFGFRISTSRVIEAMLFPSHAAIRCHRNFRDSVCLCLECEPDALDLLRAMKIHNQILEVNEYDSE